MNVIIGTLGASHTRHQSQTNPPVPLRTAAWLSGLSARHILTLPGDLRPGIHARLPLPCPNQRLQILAQFKRKPLARTLLPIKHRKLHKSCGSG